MAQWLADVRGISGSWLRGAWPRYMQALWWQCHSGTGTGIWKHRGGPMARHPVRFRSSAGRPPLVAPGDRAPDGGDRVKQVNTEREKT